MIWKNNRTKTSEKRPSFRPFAAQTSAASKLSSIAAARPPSLPEHPPTAATTRCHSTPQNRLCAPLATAPQQPSIHAPKRPQNAQNRPARLPCAPAICAHPPAFLRAAILPKSLPSDRGKSRRQVTKKGASTPRCNIPVQVSFSIERRV